MAIAAIVTARRLGMSCNTQPHSARGGLPGCVIRSFRACRRRAATRTDVVPFRDITDRDNREKESVRGHDPNVKAACL